MLRLLFPHSIMRVILLIRIDEVYTMTLDFERSKRLLHEVNCSVRWQRGAPHSPLNSDYIAIVDDRREECGTVNRETLDQLVRAGVLKPGIFDGVSTHTFQSNG